MNIVIIGAQKAGTSWLFSSLEQNPMVATAFRKEIHYFDHRCEPDFNFETYRRFAIPRLQKKADNPNYKNYIDFCLNPETAFTDEWYRNIFLLKPSNHRRLQKGEQLKFLEASPSYMVMPENGVSHMAKVLGDIEPILIIRDPIKRMISGLTMQMLRFQKRGAAHTPMSKLLNKQVLLGSYSFAIPLFRKYFSQINIIPFGRIITNPLDILRTIELKNNLPTFEYANLTQKKNSKSGKIDLEDETLAYINKACEPEYDFLKSEFGPNYLKEI